MQNLEKRLAALEKNLIKPADDLTVFIVAFDGRDADAAKQSQVTGYSMLCTEGMHWTRMPGESIEELKARAIREAPRGNGGVVVLIEHTDSESSQDAESAG